MTILYVFKLRHTFNGGIHSLKYKSIHTQWHIFSSMRKSVWICYWFRVFVRLPNASEQNAYWTIAAVLMHVLFYGRTLKKLLWQGCVKERLKASLRKFYGRYGDLINQNEIPLSRILHDILEDDHIQWQHPLISHYTNFWPCYWAWLYYRIWLFSQLHEASMEHLQRVWHANRGR